MISSVGPIPPNGTKQRPPSVQLTEAYCTAMECLDISLQLLLEKKKTALLKHEQNAMWNKEDEKNSKQQIQFLSAFKPSCHCFSRWLLHKREARVNLYKLVSAYNANRIVLLIFFFFFAITTKEGQR